MDPILPYFREELSVSLRAAEKSDDENTRAVYREQSPNTVELGGEDLEYDEGEGELRKGGSDIGPLKGALSRAHLNHFIRGQHSRAGSVHSKAITIRCTTLRRSILRVKVER